MKRPLLAGVALAGLIGCTSDPTARRPDAPPREDDASIAEAKLPPIKPDTYVAAGDLAAEQGQFAKAAGQYEQAAKLDSSAPTLKKLALCYVKADRLPAAVDAWKRYGVAAGQPDDAYGSLGYAYELARQPADAEATYKAGVAAHPDGRLTRVNYGLMLVRRNKVDDAVAQLSAVLKPPEVNYNIAGVYTELGRKDLAKFYYKRALECDPSFTPARQKLASVSG